MQTSSPGTASHPAAIPSHPDHVTALAATLHDILPVLVLSLQAAMQTAPQPNPDNALAANPIHLDLATKLIRTMDKLLGTLEPTSIPWMPPSPRHRKSTYSKQGAAHCTRPWTGLSTFSVRKPMHNW